MVRQLKAGFERGWTPDNALCFMDWCGGQICTHDGVLNGLRAVEDVDRLKKSRTHVCDWANGWMRTAFKGGRAKLHGNKTRAWNLYTVCFCQGEHQRPPAYTSIKKDGNPRHPIPWDTTCPLATLEFLFQKQEGNHRRYANWLPSGKMGKRNISDPVSAAFRWLHAQGACESEAEFDHNCGRKCFARLARALNLEYRPIFQVVADLEEVWRANYDPDLPKSTFTCRDQSQDPSVCTEAMRMFRRRVLKRGGKFLPRMSRSERLIYTSIRLQHGQEEADKALFGEDWDPMEL